MTDLPEHLTYGPGPHAEHHAALKGDYDQRHPDEPLPDFAEGPVHREIHQLLAIDANATSGPFDRPRAAPGHLEDHNLLHATYNQRHQP